MRPQIQRFDLMIYLDCPEEVAEHRYLSRQRRGDDQATFATRYTEFLYKNQDIMDFYKGVRKLVKTVLSISFSGSHEVDADIG